MTTHRHAGRAPARLLLAAALVLAAGSAFAADDPPVVTGDIKAGIEKHIADSVARDGAFKVAFEGRELSLELVRVHVEYLATLGPQSHFACVDMASSDGEFYDIDFFMHGDPGDMTVTETTVHKLNGRPYYLWQEVEDQWVRVPATGATDALQGVLPGTDAFTFRYRATLPAIAGKGACWLPLASSDAFQDVTVKSIDAPVPVRTVIDAAHGNKVLYLEVSPAESGKPIEVVYDVVRREKSAYPGDAAEAQQYLQAERMVPADGALKASAEKAVAGRDGDLMKARALYDLVMDEMRYKKFGEGWGKGDAMFACNSLYGNCTDYHAYFIGLARSVGIPARFAIGAAIPSERNDGGTDGYHCWAEFYAEGKWFPVDISEADKFAALSMYYFGHHPANRFEFSRGRDLRPDPLPASGPINFLAYPLLEVDGKTQKVGTQFLFERTACATKS